MNSLKLELAKIEQQLAAEKQKGSEGDKSIIERLETDQAGILEQIMIAEQQEREQKVQEVNNSNSEIVVKVFDALVPDPKTFETRMGLTDFGDWRTGFYQLFDGALAERTKLMDDKHASELAQKDEKIRLLSSQGMALQQQLDEANKQINDLKGVQMMSDAAYDQLSASCHHLEEENVQLKADIDDLKARHQDRLTDLYNAAAKIAELESQLEAAQKPKEESKPSQSFTDRMNEIKSKNEARIKSAVEIALENDAPFRGKLTLPEVPDVPKEGPFNSNSTDIQLPSAETPETVGACFLTPPDVGPITVPGQQFSSEVETETASKGWVLEQLAALEQKIMGESAA